MQIGTVMFNTITKHIVSFVEEDTSQIALKPEVSSRWLSPDPLAYKYAFISPYCYVENNPIIFTDPDGREKYYTADGKLIGQGIMQEAAEKIIDYAFNTVKVQRIEAFPHKENQSSIKLLKNLSFINSNEPSKESNELICYYLLNAGY